MKILVVILSLFFLSGCVTLPSGGSAPKSATMQKKAVIAITEPLHRKAYLFMKPEGKVIWDDQPELEKMADEITRSGGLTERNRVAYRVAELFKGEPKDFLLPRTQTGHLQVSYWNIRNLPLGVKQVLFLRVYDSVMKGTYREMIAFAYEDMSLDELRRIALQEGVARILRIKDMDDAFRQNGLYMVSNVPMDLTESLAKVIDPPQPQDVARQGATLDHNLSTLVGTVTRMTAGGPTAMAVGLLLGVSSGLIESSTSTTTAYLVTFMRDGTDTPEATLEAEWAGSLKPGDRLKVKRGSFTTTLERAL